MGVRYHINSKGEVKVCNAIKRPCPFGNEFSSASAAKDFLASGEDLSLAPKPTSKKHNEGGKPKKTIDIEDNIEYEYESLSEARKSYKPTAKPKTVDFNSEKIDSLRSFISNNGGNVSATKESIAKSVVSEYGLEKDGSIYHTENFAITFSKLKKNGDFSGTVAALSKIKKYDDRPIIVCATNEEENYHKLFMANTTMIDKVSHSSKELTDNKIRGSINGSNIIRDVSIEDKKGETIENNSKNFSSLFNIHQEYGFEGNIGRIVDRTHLIESRVKRFEVDEYSRETIMNTSEKMIKFVNSKEFNDISEMLTNRVDKNKEDIINVSKENPNSSVIRGNMIERLVISKEEAEEWDIAENGLGDFNVEMNGQNVVIDIKSKLMDRGSNPKGFNIDKYLEFTSKENNHYLTFLVGVDTVNNEVTSKLVPVIDKEMLKGNSNSHQLSGLESRGTISYRGTQIHKILTDESYKINIDKKEADRFLEDLINIEKRSKRSVE